MVVFVCLVKRYVVSDSLSNCLSGKEAQSLSVCCTFLLSFMGGEGGGVVVHLYAPNFSCIPP